MNRNFNDDERWLIKGFKLYGVERTEDIIKESNNYTMEEKIKLLNIRRKLIWRLLLEVPENE